ncbi:hypothetical protein GCK72_000017 [Caenorhabditis remanei]|uniref:Uncharacterized protein n=1 Tax=Caenorhabditis remanei TaxID=31234 RepID=E3MT75_CAERE|nr:hypothetical protein GCK72_000017 [Caenorhabditis remanei]EFP08625.1 hypothetical protein CRE_20412 [Caenorhabditis remanei]KAF1768205.1 hypothetical protein GCK72_000017 [Caenorhabditis remanei]
MNLLSFLLFIAIFQFSTVNTRRSKKHWPQDFNVTSLDTWQTMKKYFATVPKNEEEDHINVPIQYRVIGVRYSNGTTDIDRSHYLRPILAFIVKPKGYIFNLAKCYVVLIVMLLIVLVAYTSHGMFRSSVTVHVKDLHDENNPPRECPVALTLNLRTKREGKTPTDVHKEKLVLAAIQ